MILLKDIKGQINPVRYLSGILSARRISGSYLFSGPCGVGRALAAKAFLNEIFFPGPEGKARAEKDPFTVRKLENMQHPDVKWISLRETGVIGIGEVRGIKDFLYMKPYEFSMNAVVVEDAHKMTTEAANALLKVFEEPPENSLVILISDKRESIPETVLSRCSEVKFGLLPYDTVKSILFERDDIDEKEASILARFSQGSVGEAIRAREEGLAERYKTLADILEQLLGGDEETLMTWDTEDRNELIRDIDAMLMMLRDAALAGEGFSGHLTGGVSVSTVKQWDLYKNDPGQVYQIMERLLGFKDALVGFVNPKIVAQALPSVIRG